MTELTHGAEAIKQMASAMELASVGGRASARECAVLARVAIDGFLRSLEEHLVTIPAPDTIRAEAECFPAA